MAALALIVAAAAILRFWALGHGIPFAVGADEPEVVVRVVHMMKTGDFNPHFFDYPGFYLYVQLAVASVRFLAGAADGLWHSLDQVGPEVFYLWGRAVTAALGTATVVVVHAIGTRWGSRQALIASALMAAMPLHVRESHFVLTDVPMTFFVTVAFLATLLAMERGTASSFARAGVAAGLAASTKYYGGLVLLLPVAVALGAERAGGRRWTAAAVATGAAAGAFLFTAPYTILDLPAFLNGFAAMSGAFVGRAGSAEPGWIIYAKHLRLALGWPASIALLLGTGLALVRAASGPDRLRWALLAGFPLLYFWFLSTRVLIFGRYLMPIVPFVAVLIAVAVVSSAGMLQRVAGRRLLGTGAGVALLVAVLLPPAVMAVQFDRRASLTSTYALAYQWILARVPANATVAIETAGLRLPGDRYRVEQLKALVQRDIESYRAGGTEYLVASSQAFGAALEAPHLRPQEYAAYRRLFDQASLLVTIAPSAAHPGPELRVYRIER